MVSFLETDITLAAFNTSKIKKNYLAVVSLISQRTRFVFEVRDITYREGIVSENKKSYAAENAGLTPPVNLIKIKLLKMEDGNSREMFVILGLNQLYNKVRCFMQTYIHTGAVDP